MMLFTLVYFPLINKCLHVFNSWKGKCFNLLLILCFQEAVFESAVRQTVYEERQNQLRWQVKLGEDPLSGQSRYKILEDRAAALSHYQVCVSQPSPTDIPYQVCVSQPSPTDIPYQVCVSQPSPTDIPYQVCVSQPSPTDIPYQVCVSQPSPTDIPYSVL